MLVGEAHDVTSSLAGVTTSPVARLGNVRRGGFGGVDGLARFLRDHAVDALVDATHPFAAVMPFHAAQAAAITGIAQCRLLRSPWAPEVGDDWRRVGSVDAAARVLDEDGASRVFLAVGRQSARAFTACRDVWFLARSIEPPDDAAARSRSCCSRGPFDVDDERALLTTHRIDTFVVKDAGGTATRAKLVAARRLGLRVVVVDRPPQPAVRTFSTVTATAAWCRSRSAGCARQAAGV